jgi:hypothetical protein
VLFSSVWIHLHLIDETDIFHHLHEVYSKRSEQHRTAMNPFIIFRQQKCGLKMHKEDAYFECLIKVHEK